MNIISSIQNLQTFQPSTLKIQNMFQGFAFNSGNTSFNGNIVSFSNTVTGSTTMPNGVYVVSASSIAIYGSPSNTYANNICHCWRVFDNDATTFCEFGAINSNLTISSSTFFTTNSVSFNGYTQNAYSNTTPSNYIGGGTGYVWSTNSIQGEWIQLQLPAAVQLTQFELVARSGAPQRMPYTLYLFGSNNGSSFTQINSAYTATNNTDTIIPVTMTGKYTYYRFVINQLSSSTSVVPDIATMNLQGFL